MLQNVLGSLLVFAAFVTFCNAQCYTIRKEVTPNDLSTVFLYLWVMMKSSVRKSSTRRPAAILWWSGRTRKRPALSMDGYCNAILVDQGLPSQPHSPTPVWAIIM
ncbi:beta-microseminoprotein isoform X2 [Tupaia chinensis]|uniref:beta-microseminoprotein isoform X2 n=1 Tax=Tupaia chinensis TaxID=246437 RepID=UPI000FFB5F18|nr:beta-microseminoprotein isoform X2 [Tupaia chinensis]